MKSKRYFLLLAAVALFFAKEGVAGAASQQSIITVPSAQPDYRVEIEPHGLIAFGGPFDYGGDLGLGLRASVPLWRPGPISSINDSLALGFGADFLFFYHGAVFVPLVAQWNFYFLSQLSAFIEGGLSFTFGGYTYDRGDRYGLSVWPIIGIGGRFHFTEHLALTLRLEYPALSVGLSIYF